MWPFKSKRDQQSGDGLASAKLTATRLISTWLRNAPPAFELEAPAEGSQLSSTLQLSDEKKAEVVIALLSSMHQNVVSWTSRAFEATTWAIGLNFAVVSFVFVYPEKISLEASIVMAVGLCTLGAMAQFYLRSASRAHFGNRLGIGKCEAALGLYQEGHYLEFRSFFIYSPAMLRSGSLSVLKGMHLAATVVSVLCVLWAGASL